MKYILYGLLLVCCIAGCKKTIEEAKENAVVDAITSGFWIVTKYQKGSTDVTNSFSSYKFQFKKNNSVDALKNSAFEISGHWEADVASRSITASFANVIEPLALLNGKWTITNSTWTSVDASLIVDGEKRQLHLEKE